MHSECGGLQRWSFSNCSTSGTLCACEVLCVLSSLSPCLPAKPAWWGFALLCRYWRIKSQGLAHTVLFFQEGNFYHLKDRDADIGMRVGLQPMGGARGAHVAYVAFQCLRTCRQLDLCTAPPDVCLLSSAGCAVNMWCVGCNVSAFNEWAAKVLSLGYTVAR